MLLIHWPIHVKVSCLSDSADDHACEHRDEGAWLATQFQRNIYLKVILDVHVWVQTPHAIAPGTGVPLGHITRLRYHIRAHHTMAASRCNSAGRLPALELGTPAHAQRPAIHPILVYVWSGGRGWITGEGRQA